MTILLSFLPAAKSSIGKWMLRPCRLVFSFLNSSGNSSAWRALAVGAVNTPQYFKNGSPGVSRTPDLRFRKPLLYPSELRGQVDVTPFSHINLQNSSESPNPIEIQAQPEKVHGPVAVLEINQFGKTK